MTLDSSVVPSGIYSPVTTFFKDDGEFSLDLDSQIKHAQHLYKSGIKGLVLPGSMGESPNLSKKERHQLVAAIRKAIPDPNFKLIAGAPPLGSIAEAIEESYGAKEAGADFIILLVPGYFGPGLSTQQGIVDYFTRVADKSALPIVLYNYPGTCNNVSISAESYDVLGVHPNIVGAKLTHLYFDLYAILGQNPQFKKNNFKVFTGMGQVLVPAVAVGITGAIDAMSAIFPKVMVKLFDLIQEGKIEEANELQAKVARADLMIPELNINGTKHAVKQFLGFGEHFTGRPPLSKPLDLKAYAKYEQDLKVLAEIEATL